MPFINSVEYNFAFNAPMPVGLITNGLVIQLDAYLSSSYPGTGTTVTDITGGYNHTLASGATFLSLYGVKTFDCTSSNKIVQVNGSGPTLPTSGYSYVTWARVIPSSASWRTLFRTTPNDHPILVQISTDNLGFYDNDTVAFIDSGYDVTTIEDLWVQYTVVGDNASSVFYINGVQVGTTAKGAGGNAHWVWGNVAGGQPFGYVANMYYYSRKLSSAEVNAMYNYLSPRFLNIIMTGLVRNFQAGNASSYPGSGTSWTDLANVTAYSISSTTTIYSSTNGGSILFNGSDTVVPIGTPLSNGANYSLEAWALASVTSGAHNIVSSFNNVLFVSAGTLYGGVGGNYTLVSSANFPLNLWKHVVLTFNDTANTMILYVDGVQVNQNTTVTLSFISEVMRIGSHATSGGTPTSYWNGRIAMVRIYNSVLSAADVLNNFNATKTGLYVTASNLVLYYNPGDTASYPGSGTTLSNLLGTGLNGTMTSITFTTPYFTYNGSTSQVSIADNVSLEPGSGDWTVEVWLRYNVIAGRTRTYVSKVDNGGLASVWGYGFRTNANLNTTYFEVGNGTTSVTSPTTSVTTAVWYQIVGVWTNVGTKTIALYKNGTLVGSNSHSFTSIRNTSNPLYLGNYNGNEFAQQFDGDMGVVRIYNKALSAAEVQTNYDANKALYGLT